MSNIKVSGSASGTGEITIAAPVTNSSRTQTLPDATGTVMLDSAATVSGNLTFTGTGNRITGDFTNGSRPNRVMFQTSTADSPTRLGAIPSGTGTVSEFSLYNTSDPSNASTGQLLLNATEFRIANAITGTGTYVPITFYNNGSEQMRLTTAGNFGIGTSTPSTKLHVNAGRTTLSANNEPYSLQLNNGSVTNGPFLGSAGADIFVISTGGGAERLRLDASGNVGIGTSSPEAGGRLTLDRASFNQLFMKVNGTTELRFYADAALSSIASDTNPLLFEVNGAERARITSGGDLLVGTTTATEKLTVAGNISINTSGNPFLQIRTSGSGNNPYVRLQADTNYWDVQGTFSNAGDELYFNYNGNARAYINSATGAYTAVSDQRLKKDITDISYGLSAVMALRPVEYLMRDEPDDAQKHLGFIAQEALEVVPSSVSLMTGDTYGMDKTEIVAVLVKAIQELKAELDSVKAELNALKGT